MTEEEIISTAKVEIERLRKLREHFRKREIAFKDMDMKRLKEDENYFFDINRPEYKIEQIYKILGEQLASKLDSLITFLETHDTK